MGEVRSAYRTFIATPEGKGALERPRHRWERYIKMSFREVGQKSVDWILLAEDSDQRQAVIKAVINCRVS
jgi:hypothetical protein